MKNLFVSYGRRESLGFVGRMHQKFKLMGYDAWFDKVNIPDGDDYALRISNGIEDAQNFVYVMAPRCLTSPYCLIEIEYARLLGKRVIPVNQMVIFDTEEIPLSAGDQAVMTNFYNFHNVPDQNIKTTADVLKRTHELLGRTDWVYAREEMTEQDISDLFNWQAEYENFWHKHDDLDYLKSFDFPRFGKSVDDFDSVVESVIRLIEKQKDYVYLHSKILSQALHWNANQRSTNYLPVGKERQAMERWLLTEFIPPKQPPCIPTHLQCDFICDARKNAENRQTDVFICYDAKDKVIRDMVIHSVSRFIITTWTHDKDIQKGATFERAIEEGIEQASNFFFFISPNSVKSDYCLKELAHAQKFNKRIIPLLVAPTEEKEIPEILKSLQYVDFTDNKVQTDYDEDIDDILNILRNEESYFEEHKILLARALKWKSENQKQSFLLRGHNLENAQTWLRLNAKRQDYTPTELHKEFILSSEAVKGQLHTDVFISYSRKDGDFARNLNTKLQEAGKMTWFDQESISTGVDFEKEIFKGIEGADSFLFVISSDAVESEYCEREVEYAQSLNKRFITILCRETDPTTMPEALRVINWLDFESQNFATVFPELIQTLDLDREHSHQHTILQQRAMEWHENERIEDFLLNKTAYENAQKWLSKALETQKQPFPTDLQTSYISDTQQAIELAEAKEKEISKTLQKRLKNTQRALVMAGIMVVIALVAGVLAWNQSEKADKKTQEAEKATITAVKNGLQASQEIKKFKSSQLKNTKTAKESLNKLGAVDISNQLQSEIDTLKHQVDSLNRVIQDAKRKLGKRNKKNEGIILTKLQYSRQILEENG